MYRRKPAALDSPQARYPVRRPSPEPAAALPAEEELPSETAGLPAAAAAAADAEVPPSEPLALPVPATEAGSACGLRRDLLLLAEAAEGCGGRPMPAAAAREASSTRCATWRQLRMSSTDSWRSSAGSRWSAFVAAAAWWRACTHSKHRSQSIMHHPTSMHAASSTMQLQLALLGMAGKLTAAAAAEPPSRCWRSRNLRYSCTYCLRSAARSWPLVQATTPCRSPRSSCSTAFTAYRHTRLQCQKCAARTAGSTARHNGAVKYALQRANMRSSTAGPASSPALTSKARCAGPAGASRLGSRAQTCFGWCTRRGGPTAQAYRLPAVHPSSGAGGAPLLLPSPASRRCCCHPPKPQWWGPTAEACCESSSWWGSAHTPAAAAAAPLPGWLTLPQRAPAPPARLRCCRCCRAASTLPRP